jgi:hypothetical protein
MDRPRKTTTMQACKRAVQMIAIVGFVSRASEVSTSTMLIVSSSSSSSGVKMNNNNNNASPSVPKKASVTNNYSRSELIELIRMAQKPINNPPATMAASFKEFLEESFVPTRALEFMHITKTGTYVRTVLCTALYCIVLSPWKYILGFWTISLPGVNN